MMKGLRYIEVTRCIIGMMMGSTHDDTTMAMTSYHALCVKDREWMDEAGKTINDRRRQRVGSGG